MQRPDDAKRKAILDAAAQLFAARPYHEVRLEEVATAAHVGKGTLYVYFASKEELYISLVRDGFREMAASLEAEMAGDADTWTRLAAGIRALIRFGTRYPDLYRVMRNQSLTPDDAAIQATRREVCDVLERVLVEGRRRGEVDDPNPALTTQFMLSFVRGALLYPPPGMTPQTLEDHIIRVLRRGLQKGGTACGHAD